MSEPNEDENITETFAPWESIAIYVCMAFFSVISLVCIAVGAGAIYQHFFN